MSKNYYSEINLHFVWHTKLSAPLLTPKIETMTHQFIRQRLINTPGVFFHEIGGTENHVHAVITVAPTILISDLIGKTKGSSSHEINQRMGNGKKSWNGNLAMGSLLSAPETWIGSKNTSATNGSIIRAAQFRPHYNSI